MKAWIFSLLASLILLLAGYAIRSTSSPVAVNGNIDITSWNFTTDSPIEINEMMDITAQPEKGCRLTITFSLDAQ